MAWDKSDIEAGHRFKRDLNDPESTLFLFMQCLISLREQNISKMKKARIGDSIFKSVGILEGIDLAMNEPKRIIDEWEKEMNARLEEVNV